MNGKICLGSSQFWPNYDWDDQYIINININILSAGGRCGEFCLPVCSPHGRPRQPRKLPQLIHPQATSIHSISTQVKFKKPVMDLRRVLWDLLRKPMWNLKGSLLWINSCLNETQQTVWSFTHFGFKKYLQSELNHLFYCRPVLRRKAKPEKRFKDKFSEEVYYDLPRTLWPKLVKLHPNPSH